MLEDDAYWCGILSQAVREMIYLLEQGRPLDAVDYAADVLGRYDKRAPVVH